MNHYDWGRLNESDEECDLKKKNENKEYRLDETNGRFYTKEEFYNYYGSHGIWYLMDPKKICIRNVIWNHAYYLNFMNSEQFKTYMDLLLKTYE